MSIFLAFIGAALAVPVACLFAWMILSNWLFGRSLIIASVASAVSLNLGRYGYSGPPNEAALVALAGVAGAILGGILTAKIWLARAAKNNGLLDG